MTTPDGRAAAPSNEVVLELLKAICAEEIELPPEQVAKIDGRTSVVEGLQLDSLSQVILLGRIEEHYGFVFETEHRERLQSIQTVQELIDIIQERVEERRGAGEGAR